MEEKTLIINSHELLIREAEWGITKENFHIWNCVLYCKGKTNGEHESIYIRSFLSSPYTICRVKFA